MTENTWLYHPAALSICSFCLFYLLYSEQNTTLPWNIKTEKQSN